MRKRKKIKVGGGRKERIKREGEYSCLAERNIKRGIKKRMREESGLEGRCSREEEERDTALETVFEGI